MKSELLNVPVFFSAFSENHWCLSEHNPKWPIGLDLAIHQPSQSAKSYAFKSTKGSSAWHLALKISTAVCQVSAMTPLKNTVHIREFTLSPECEVQSQRHYSERLFLWQQQAHLFKNVSVPCYASVTKHTSTPNGIFWKIALVILKYSNKQRQMAYFMRAVCSDVHWSTGSESQTVTGPSILTKTIHSQIPLSLTSFLVLTRENYLGLF